MKLPSPQLCTVPPKQTDWDIWHNDQHPPECPWSQMQNLERLWCEAQQPDDNRSPTRSKYISITGSKQLMKEMQVLNYYYSFFINGNASTKLTELGYRVKQSSKYTCHAWHLIHCYESFTHLQTMMLHSQLPTPVKMHACLCVCACMQNDWLQVARQCNAAVAS